MKKKIEREREREREREITFFVRGNYAKNWKKEWQIYSKMVWIRRDKIREDEEKDEWWY